MGKLLEDQINIIKDDEILYALQEAWKKVYAEYPSINSLALLWAQWVLTTERGKNIHCYNLGRIKRTGEESYCMYRCSERMDGKLVYFNPPDPQTWFRAYPSLLCGAYDYIKFLSRLPHYQQAWLAVQEGDPYNFGHELTMTGCYNQDETTHICNLVFLMREVKSKTEKILSWQQNENDDPSWIPPSAVFQPVSSHSTTILPPPFKGGFLRKIWKKFLKLLNNL